MCIFCKIVNREIPSNKVLENDEFMAFHDLYPVAPIHILIVSKKHIECFQDTPADIMGKMTPFIQEVAKILGVDKSGHRLIVNNGEDGGQEIRHLHFHLIGGAKSKFPPLHEDNKKSI